MHRKFACRPVAGAVFALAGAMVAADLHAATVFTDGFNDADRNNDGIADDGTSAVVPTPNGVPWYLGRGTSSATVSVVNDNGTPGIGSGNALSVSSTTTSQRPIVAVFPDTTVAAGQTLTAAFDFRIITNPVPTADRHFRFGFFNNEGTSLTADTSPSATTNDDAGYLAEVDTGGDTNSVSAEVSDSAVGSFMSTLNGDFASTNNAAFDVTDNSIHHAVFTVANTAGDGSIDLTFTLDSLYTLTGNSTAKAAGSVLTTTFNEFAIGENGVAIGFNVDNVTVSTTSSVPEPSSAAVLLLGSTALLRRRRCSHGGKRS